MNRYELTKEMRWYVADRLAEDRLPVVNDIVETITPKSSFYSKYGKRYLDIAISSFALVVTLPVNMIIGLVTFFDVGVPVFFRQERTGKDGRTFEMLKFRNMRNTRDERGELLDPTLRVTKWGQFVRRTSLDELLNFWSVLKGDMSIIGPRPLVPEYLGRYNKRHLQRLAVRPGLECPPRMPVDHAWTWQDQFENDVWYVENVSFKTDCYMMYQLVRFTFDHKHAAERGSAMRETFMGYDVNGTVITLTEVPQEYIDECDRWDTEKVSYKK